MHFAHWCHLWPSHQHIEKKVKGCDPIVPQVDQKHLELSCPLFARSYWKHDGKSKGAFILPNILPKCSCHFAHLGMGQNHSKITIEITTWFREWPSKNPSYDLGYHPAEASPGCRCSSAIWATTAGVWIARRLPTAWWAWKLRTTDRRWLKNGLYQWMPW